jgi:glycosyltransferase involved in cell wall biosynthesis
VRSAERAIVVERPVGDDFRRRLGVDAGYVPNGWDPDLARDAETATPPELDPRKITLVHTGKLSGGWGRHPGTLFEALRRLQDRDPRLGDRLQLVLAGRLDHDEQRLIAGAGIDGLVRHVGMLSRSESIALQRRADVLVLLTSATLVWELPGKVFEYFGARRPILALAKDNEAARVIAETGTGWTIAPDDVEGIMARLDALVRQGPRLEYDDARIARYIYPAPAEALEVEIELAIEGRRATA